MNDISVSQAQSPAAPNVAIAPDRDADLRRTAQEFESIFVAQMLQYSGLSKAVSANGGFGGEAFASLLIEEYAARLVERGGFGVADKVYEQLRDKEASNAGRDVA